LKEELTLFNEPTLLRVVNVQLNVELPADKLKGRFGCSGYNNGDNFVIGRLKHVFLPEYLGGNHIPDHGAVERTLELADIHLPLSPANQVNGNPIKYSVDGPVGEGGPFGMHGHLTLGTEKEERGISKETVNQLKLSHNRSPLENEYNMVYNEIKENIEEVE